MKLVKLLYLLALMTNLVIAQKENFNKSQHYERLAFKNYSDKKYDSLLINFTEAEKLRPNHPRLVYNIASAYALNGDKKKAFTELRKLVKMSLYFPVEKDSDFISLWNEKDFKNLVKDFKKNLLHVGKSTTAFTYPEKDLIPESIAYDPITGKFYLSSIFNKKIVSLDKNGNYADFKNEGEDGLWSVFGIRVDSKRRILWACTGAVQQTKNIDKKDIGKAAVFKYDIYSKKLIRKYELDNKTAEHTLGDLTISSSGDIYISDSRFNAIYKIPVNSDSMEIFLEPGKFVSLQGLDFSADGKSILLADYALGLFKIDLESKNITEIKSITEFTPLGIDGLYFYNNSLIATQNGINPQRVVRIFLNNNLDQITKYSILEQNNKYFDEITLGLIKGDEFYFIANSQWGSFEKDRNILFVDKLKEPRVLKTQLKLN